MSDTLRFYRRGTKIFARQNIGGTLYGLGAVIEGYSEETIEKLKKRMAQYFILVSEL